MSGKFIFFGCWNKIDCEKEYLYRDIVLDYIKIKEKRIKSLFVAGDNWYSSIIESAKYYLVGVLVSGYYKLYEIGEDKNIHIAVGNHDEAFDKESKKNTKKTNCMINTQKYYIDYIKTQGHRKKPYSDPIKSPSPSAQSAAPSLTRAQSFTQDLFTFKKEKKVKNVKLMDLFKETDKLPSIEKLHEDNGQISEEQLNIYVDKIGVVENDDKYIMIIINTNNFDKDPVTANNYLRKIFETFEDVKNNNIQNKVVFVMGHIPLFLHKNKKGKESIKKAETENEGDVDNLFNLLAMYNYIYLCADTHNFNIMKIVNTTNNASVIQVTCGTGGADPDIITENATVTKNVVVDNYTITYNSVNSYGYSTISMDTKRVIKVCYNKLISHIASEPISIKTYNYNITNNNFYYHSNNDKENDQDMIKISKISSNSNKKFCDNIIGKNVNDLIITSEVNNEPCFKKEDKKEKGPKKSKSPQKVSSLPSMFSMSSSRKRRVQEFKKKRAEKIIQKLTMPFINRVSANIDDRINTYKMYYKYLSKYDENQCLKIHKENNKVTYSLANDNIKIVQKIGTKSSYGDIYLSKGTNTGELFRFASKIMLMETDNLIEIDVLKKLTNLVIEKKNPHFPIMYYNFTCSDPELNNDLPPNVNNQSYYININELANGDAKMFVHKHYSDDKKLRNALMQIFISIYSFHSFGYLQEDAHWGNFLYHRIKPGGYMKYIINGKELYLENLGYLWVIWDFGFIMELSENNTMYAITADYKFILNGFANVKNKGLLADEFPYLPSTNDLVDNILGLIDNCRKRTDIHDNFDIAFFDEFIRLSNVLLTKEELPKDTIILNKGNPYKIGS
jgi:hypothetical protein